MHLTLQSSTDRLVVPIKFIDHNQIGDFHHSLLSSLEAITAARRHHIDHKVNYMVDFDLRLTYAYCFNDHSIEACMFTQKLDLPSVECHAPKDAFSGRWSDKCVYFL